MLLHRDKLSWSLEPTSKFTVNTIYTHVPDIPRNKHPHLPAEGHLTTITVKKLPESSCNMQAIH